MKNIFTTFFLFLFIFTNLAFSQSFSSKHVLKDLLSNPETSHKIKQIETLEASLNLTETDRLISTLLKSLNSAKQKETYHYFLARLYMVKTTFYTENTINNTEAKKSLESALMHSKKLIKIRKDFSDGHRLVADIYGWLIDFNIQAIVGPVYSAKASKHLKKASKYDKTNPFLYLSKGRNYFYKPIFVGGSKKKALQAFIKAESLAPNDYEPKLWLGQFYMSQGKFRQADEKFKEALSIQKESFIAKRELLKIKKQEDKS